MNSKLKIKNPKSPFVFVNVAMTADGKIAFANRDFEPFGSARDARHLYELRAQADAVMCGARTVEITKTVLGNGGENFRKLRLKNGLAEFPLRVVVSGSGKIRSDLPIFKMDFSPLIVLTTERISNSNLKKLNATGANVKICGKTEIDFAKALRWLKSEFGAERILCEGGGELNDALFRADLVDEIHLTICPKIFGGKTAPTLSDGQGFEKLDLARKFKLQSARDFQGELFTVFSRLI